MGSCTNRLAIVTGGSRGIGQAIALRLAAEGADVAVAGRTLTPGSHPLSGSLEETVAVIEERGGRALAVQADLGDPDFDRGEIVRAATQAFGRPVDILVNNAAAPREFHHRFHEVPSESFHTSVEVNVWAAWDLMKRVVPGMRESGAGWVLNVSSRAAGGAPGPPYHASPVGSQSLYGSSKAMLDRMTRGAAMDLCEDGIAVNTLAPEAAVATENALNQLDLPKEICEPLETFAEASLALCTGDPAVLTGRVAYSLSLLVELERPVRSLDGTALVPGWQPEEIDRKRLRPSYLAS